jgi:hypothetical protein
VKNLSLKTTTFAMIFFSTLSAAFGAELPAQDDLVAQAVFANDPRVTAPKGSGSKSVGIVMEGLSGFGLIYNQTISQDRSAWLHVKYRPENYMMLERFEPSKKMAAAFGLEKNREVILLGVDQTFHPTQNKYWGFVLGLGVGLARAEYEVRYHPQLCSFFCGFNGNSYVQTNPVDTYALIASRIGVAIRETRIWGAKGDLVISINPQFSRFPDHVQFIGPDGREVKPLMPDSSTIAVEGTIEI